jgi:O-antigen/teichoic acid export membrane protein
MNLHRRLLSSMAANGFTQAITIASQILLLPLFLLHWGTDRYGEWLVLSAMASYFSVTDIGLSSYLGNLMSLQVSSGKQDEARLTFNSGLALLFTCIVIAFILGSVVITMTPIGSLLKLEVLDEASVMFTALALLSYTLLGLFGGLAHALYRTAGQYARSIFINNLARVLEVLATVLTLTMGGGTVLLAGSFLVIRAASILFQTLDVSRMVLWARPDFHLVRMDRIRSMMLPSASFMAFPLANATSQQGITLVTATILGSQAVVVLNTARTLAMAVKQFMSVINHAIWPEITHLFGSGDLDQARRLHRAACKWVGLFGVVSCMWLSMLSPDIFKWWTQGQVAPSALLVNFLLVMMGLSAFWVTSSVTLTATNHHHGLSVRYILSALWALITTGLLCGTFGLPLIGLALLTGEILFLAPYTVRTSLGLLQEDMHAFIMSSFLPVIGVALPSAVILYAAAQFPLGIPAKLTTLLGVSLIAITVNVKRHEVATLLQFRRSVHP